MKSLSVLQAEREATLRNLASEGKLQGVLEIGLTVSEENADIFKELIEAEGFKFRWKWNSGDFYFERIDELEKPFFSPKVAENIAFNKNNTIRASKVFPICERFSISAKNKTSETLSDFNKIEYLDSYDPFYRDEQKYETIVRAYKQIENL